MLNEKVHKETTYQQATENTFRYSNVNILHLRDGCFKDYETRIIMVKDARKNLLQWTKKSWRRV